MQRQDLNFFKGVAIIAVILYHLGVCNFGFLGVDMFFVISGFLTTKTLLGGRIYDFKSYCVYIAKRLVRLMPILILASITCLVIGYILMLPDDYENLSESVVATLFCSNNILSCITTSNYWDVVNDYKPLMHTWYVGVLVQFYFVYPAVYLISHKLGKGINKSNSYGIILGFLAILSLVLFFFFSSDAERFYYLPYRLFEFCAGGLSLLYLHNSRVSGRISFSNILLFICCLIIFILFFLDICSFDKRFKLVITVFVSSLILGLLQSTNQRINRLYVLSGIPILGACSYSFFVWHQIVFAYTRYSFTNVFTIPIILLVLFITCILSYITYRFVERININRKNISILVILFILTNGYSLYIFFNAGVTRDVPELDIYYGCQQRGMHAQYCDGGYFYDKDFVSEDKNRWLVVGNSFGRDWVNIINESHISNKVEVSYMEDLCINEGRYNDTKLINRINSADIIFYATKGLTIDKINSLRSIIDNKTFYVVGEKNFGMSNGIIYKYRFSNNYKNLTVSMESGYEEKNQQLLSMYSNCYVDLISIVKQPNGNVRVFTDDNRFISQDCRHLTKAGAQFFADKIDWDQFFHK